MKFITAAILAAFALMAGPVAAQNSYPERPVKVIVPYSPGGATDIVARIVGDEFQKITGQGFVVLNKPGAFGMLAIDEMIKAPADGYTLMIGNASTNAITPIIYANKMNSDYSKNVVAVTNLVDIPAFLLVGTANDFPVKSVRELVEYVKKYPAKFVTAPSASVRILITIWPILQSARAISTWSACRTRTALLESFKICCAAMHRPPFSTWLPPPGRCRPENSARLPSLITRA